MCGALPRVGSLQLGCHMDLLPPLSAFTVFLAHLRGRVPVSDGGARRSAGSSISSRPITTSTRRPGILQHPRDGRVRHRVRRRSARSRRYYGLVAGAGLAGRVRQRAGLRRRDLRVRALPLQPAGELRRPRRRSRRRQSAASSSRSRRAASARCAAPRRGTDRQDRAHARRRARSPRTRPCRSKKCSAKPSSSRST